MELPYAKWTKEFYDNREEYAKEQDKRDYQRYLELSRKFETNSTHILTASEWKVLRLPKGFPPKKGSEITIRFKEDGTVEGSTGVNSFSGRYEANHSDVGKGDLCFLSGFSCTERSSSDRDLMFQEENFLETLPLISHFGIAGTTLELRTSLTAQACIGRSPMHLEMVGT